MKLVHLADLHLGFRQYDRLAPSGVNQREVDCALTFSRTVRQIAAEQPDIVLIGGDVFHQTRPSNPAIVHAFAQFDILRRALPNTPIVIVAGNHDAPRTADAGCILQLFRELGITVVENAAQWLEFPELSLDLLAIPDVIGIERPELKPRETSLRHRVLLMHGEIEGMMAVKTSHEIPVYELHAEDWSYIALGHYHVYREVAPRAYYSGSLDYTSTNPWGELREQEERGVPGKGFIVHDLDTNAHRFVPVPASRPFLELATIDCAGLTAVEVDAQIRVAVETSSAPIEQSVSRVVLLNAPRHLLHELDQAAIREYKTRALHFQLVARKPEDAVIALDIDAPDRRVTLEDTVASYLREFPIAPELDRGAFVNTGLAFMQQASDTLAATATVEA